MKLDKDLRPFFSVIIISFQFGNVLIHTELSVIFAFMSAYTVSTIMLSFFLSTLFNKANIAAAAGGIIFFCIYLPYTFMVVWESKITHSIRIASVSKLFKILRVRTKWPKNCILENFGGMPYKKIAPSLILEPVV